MSDPLDTTPKNDLIILVHGTGAADPADRGQKWWQTGSAFYNALAKLLQPLSVIGPPFHWSGMNSEAARRKAGQALFDRLLDLAESGRRIHLVGHSHGGSVIWHALTISAARNKRLTHLRSWCTVGTPFLTFAPRWPSHWRWLATLVLWLVFFQLLYGSDYKELPAIAREIWNQGDRWPIVGYFGLLLTAAALWSWATAHVLVPTVAKALLSLRRNQAAVAASWYGDLWLGLWHPLDEPINSLAGTMGSAPEIAPRSGHRLLFQVVPLLGFVWNSVLMRAGDEFAWRQVTNRAQGADVANQFVVDVGRAPKPLEPGFDSLPHDVVDELAASANSHSIGVVAKVRALLENAYDQKGTETVVDRMTDVLTFQELIHTSYFDHPAIAKTIAAFVKAQSTDGSQARSLPAFVPRRADPTNKLTAASPPSLGALEFVAALALFILPALGLWVSIRTATEAVVMPYKPTYQFQRIKEFVDTPKTLAAGNGSHVAALLLELEAKGLVTDPTSFLSRIPQDVHRRQAAMRLAYDFGRESRIAKIKELLDRKEPADLYPEYAAHIRSLAFIGNSTRKISQVGKSSGAGPQDEGGYDPAILALVDTFVDMLAEAENLSSTVRIELTRIVIARLALSGEFDRAQKILGFVQSRVGKTPGYSPSILCNFAQALAIGRATLSPAANLRDLVDLCDTDERKNTLKRAVSFAVLMSKQATGLLAFGKANDFLILGMEGIEARLSAAMKDKDEPEEKTDKLLNLLLPDIVLLEMILSPDQVDRLGLKNAWPAQLASDYFERIVTLARLTRVVGAVHVSNILLDVAEREANTWTEPELKEMSALIKGLADGGRKDQARKAYSKYIEFLKSRKIEDGNERLILLHELAGAAAAMKDNSEIIRLADEVSKLTITSPGSTTGSLVAGVANRLWNFDPKRAMALTYKASAYSLIASDDLIRNAMGGILVEALAQSGDIRQARIAAFKIESTDWALVAMLHIFKPADGSRTRDFSELSALKPVIKNIIEGELKPPRKIVLE